MSLTTESAANRARMVAKIRTWEHALTEARRIDKYIAGILSSLESQYSWKTMRVRLKLWMSRLEVLPLALWVAVGKLLFSVQPGEDYPEFRK